MQAGVRWEGQPVQCSAPWCCNTEQCFMYFAGWKSFLPLGFPVSIQSSGFCMTFIQRNHICLVLYPVLSYSSPHSVCPLSFPKWPLSLCFHFLYTHLYIRFHTGADVGFVQVWLILLSITFGSILLSVWPSSISLCIYTHFKTRCTLRPLHGQWL